MIKSQARIVMVKCSDNSSNLENVYARNDYTNSVGLSTEENEVQHELNRCNIPQENRKCRGRNDLDSNSLENRKVSKEQSSGNVKSLTCRIPNILKNSPKLHKVVKESSNETVFVNMKENVQEAYNSIIALDSSSSGGSYGKDGNKCDRPIHRRKQEHNFIDIWQKSPNWNIHTFVDDKKEIKSCKKGKRIRRGTKRDQKRKNTVLDVKTKNQKENSLPSTPHSISIESTTELHVPSYPEATESMDFIDFSSNEIFSNFDFTEYAIDSDGTFNSSTTIYNSEIYEKKYDMNGNELDTDEMQYSMLSECWSKDNKKPNCSSSLCCSYCNEDCAAHWIQISEKKNMLSVKDRVLSNNVVINNNEINRQAFDCSYLPVAEANTNLSNESLNEEYGENNTYSLIPNILDICTFNEECNENSLFLLSDEHNESNSYVDILNLPEIVSQYELENVDMSSTDSTISCIEDIDEEILQNLTGIGNEEYNVYHDINEDMLHELELAITSLESKEMDILQDQVYTREDSNDDQFQCLLCPLTFFSARTMAMHQAGAHGGMYVILCECCGRLFNRKYHFNRHFIHCGRLKEPYKCDMCMKNYRHKSSLIHHLKVAHKVQYASNRSKTHTCGICKKIYSKFGAFENHMKRHKNDF